MSVVLVGKKAKGKSSAVPVELFRKNYGVVFVDDMAHGWDENDQATTDILRKFTCGRHIRPSIIRLEDDPEYMLRQYREIPQYIRDAIDCRFVFAEMEHKDSQR